MSEFPKKAEDKVNTFGIVVVGVVSAVLLWASVVALQAYYNNTDGPVQELREAEGRNATVRQLKAEQKAQLQQAMYADAKEGSLKRLPIDRAMELVVDEAQSSTASLVRSDWPHKTPTIPAQFGKPADDATVAPADDPADGEPADGQPADGEPADGEPADGEPAEAGDTDGEDTAAPAPDDGAADPAGEPSAPADGEENP